MEKQLFVLTYSLSDSFNQIHAGFKAKDDINQILITQGYNIHTITKAPSTVKTIHNILSIKEIPRKSHVIVQYPLGNYPLKTIFILLMLKSMKIRTTILIHDLQSLRINGKISASEKFALNTADCLIAHTEEMKRKLISIGIHTPITILQLFDYLVEKTPNENINVSNRIVFAGNFKKSSFIKDLPSIPLTKYHFALYGLPKVTSSLNVTYEGSFSPEDLSQIKGNWGLVWDGDSLESCSSSLGEYLRYIAPHKLSMYLAAGLPVIVWKESAEADFIEKNKLGITIDSLYNLEKKLDTLSESEIQTFRSNVRKISMKLRNGEMIKRVLVKEQI